MLKRIQGVQQSTPFTLGAEERSHGVGSQQRSARHSGSHSKSNYSPATAAGMIHASGEAMSHRTAREEAASGHAPSLGYKAGPKALSTLNRADLESKKRSEAFLEPSSGSRN